MCFGGYEFAIEIANFRHITDSWSGPGWDFNICGKGVGGENLEIFPYGAKLLCEAAPLPIAKRTDYCGLEIFLPGAYDEVSGESLFGLNVSEEHDVSDVWLRFSERSGDLYLVNLKGIVAKTVLGSPCELEISAWIKELPDHTYPK